jgi:hypothetical protein
MFLIAFYRYSQTTSLIKEMNLPKPKVYKIDDFIKYVSTNILDKKFKNSSPSFRICDKTQNYMLYKPLNPDGNKLENPADNMFQYMMYLSTMSLGTLDKNPRFMFWTEFNNSINFKYFPDKPLQENQDTLNKIDAYNFRYAVYDGDQAELKLITMENHLKKFIVIIQIQQINLYLKTTII